MNEQDQQHQQHQQQQQQPQQAQQQQAYYYNGEIEDPYVSSIVYDQQQQQLDAITDPNQNSPIPSYVGLQNVAEPRSLSNNDLTDMHSMQLAAHPNHPHIPQHQHQQQPTPQQHQHPQIPLTVDISYQAPQLHQQLYTPIHATQHELLQHHHYHQPPPSTGSSSSIPSTPPPPSPSDSLSLGHQQLVNTPYSDSIQSPLHSASSSISDHSFPQPHHHHQHNPYGFQVASHSHSTGTTSGSGSIIGAASGTGGPGSITPSTTPSSGAASPIITGAGNILGSGNGHGQSPTSSATSSRSSSLVHRTGNHPSGRYHPHSGGRKGTNNTKVDYGTPQLSVATTPAPTPQLVGYNSGSATATQSQANLSHQSGYISDDDDMGILSPSTPHHPHGVPSSAGHPFTPTVPSQHSHGASVDSAVHARREATRRQRIEAEQRRRDELREGYARLKDVLPITNQKSSKVSLLERAIQHIVNLSKLTEALQARVTSQDEEIQRLRALTERMNGTPGSGPGETNVEHDLTIYPPLPGSDAGTPSQRGSGSYASGGEAFVHAHTHGHDDMSMMGMQPDSVNGKVGMTRLGADSDDELSIMNPGGISPKMEDVDVDVHIAQTI